MKTTTLALAAALAVTAAGASYAQQPPGPPPTDGREWGPRHERMHPDPAQMAERRAQRLRDLLQLRPEQEPALRAFLEASRPTGDRMGRGLQRPDRDQARPLTTPEHLDRMRERLAERQAAFERRAAATKRFYAQLSPSQQKAFDAMPMHGRPGGDRGGFRRDGRFSVR